MWSEVQCLLLVLSTVASNDVDCSHGKNSKLQFDDVKCRCVPYWMCSEDTGTIVIDGSGLIVPKTSLISPECETCGTCDETEVCCREPSDFEELSWDTCGVNKYEDASLNSFLRIMNNDRNNIQTRFAEFPWTLLLLVAGWTRNGEWNKYIFNGAASIIHPKVALTAAHLVKGVNQSLITVRAGEWNTADITEEISHQDRGVEQVIIHPNFNKVALHNDIALLILDEPFQLANNVAPICLPIPDDSYDPLDCLAVGWGKSHFGETGKYSTTMRKVHLPIVSDDVCEKQLKKAGLGPRFRLHYSFICAGGIKGQDTCVGDGGGPLMCRNEDDKYVQVGIVSWGVKCGNMYPGVYTKVSEFLTWINANTVSLEFRR